MNVVVIGGGPAGMLAAYSSKKEGNNVTLLEKTDSLGKKLCITGKGRCNITSSLEDMNDFIKNTPGNGRFLFSCYQQFTNQDILDLLDIPTKVERGDRIFPVSDSARDVLDALVKKLNGVVIKTNVAAQKIIIKDGKVIGVLTNHGSYDADKVIIATGGMSYPGTGSSGDGYKLAEDVGHTIKEPKPALVPLLVSSKDKKYCKMMQGLSLKNVEITILKNDKKIYNDFGEMLFTHEGISGPIVLSSSVNIVNDDMQNLVAEIDMKPALSEEVLDDRILRDFEKYKNREFKNSLDDLLPQKMIPVIVALSGIDEDKKVNEVTKEERRNLVQVLKHLRFEISGLGSFNEAIVTAGGVNIKEINPKTMESKLVEGLYFAGEVIDVYAYTGGFNLQSAYSTGYVAGLDY